MRWLINIFVFCFPLISIAQDLPLASLKLPSNVSIGVYADSVINGREMCLGPKDIVFVSARELGKIYAIIPDKSTPTGTKVITVITGLHHPENISYDKGNLYVAEAHRILRFNHIENHLNYSPKPVIISQISLPKNMQSWRFMGLGPDKKLYITLSGHKKFATNKEAMIIRMNTDGSHREIYAKGVRTKTGFNWSPISKEVWVTENNIDWMGDNLSTSPFNYSPAKGMNFGFPYYHGNTTEPLHDKEQFAIKDFTLPILKMPEHISALGLTFYMKNQFPHKYKDLIFMTEKNYSSTHQDYKILSVELSGNKIMDVKPFISGWIQNGKQWGHPVDLIVLRNGTLLISDDYAHVVYKVNYENPHG